MNFARLLLLVFAVGLAASCARQADAPAPTASLDAGIPGERSIAEALDHQGLGCGQVIATELIVRHAETDFYFVKCSDGAEYVYARDNAARRHAVITCDEALERGMYCPSYFREGQPQQSRMATPDARVIEQTLKNRNLACSRVSETRLIANQVATDFYFVRCADGPEYVYIHDYPTHSYSVTSCADVADRGMTCPD